MAVAEPGALPGFFVAPLLWEEFDELNHSRVAGAHERGSGTAGFSIGQIDIDCYRLIGLRPSGTSKEPLSICHPTQEHRFPASAGALAPPQIGGK